MPRKSSPNSRHHRVNTTLTLWLLDREKNALARILNSRYMARYESLEPLVSLKNQPIWKFPSSLERLDSMTVDDVNLVLQALGQPHQGDITKARRRLALLAGCIAIAY
ncbi:hypothetical protein F5Y08DRAFT_297795 [Xylaria arbuscula]|nr:hypothetical protein F5Y08DRAFT_297795 [Xylaria arbuscula]